MAESLIESMVADFDPEEFSDDYREAMTALIESKQAGGEVHTPEPEVEEDSGGQVVDLMSALRASVARAKGVSAAPATSTGSNRSKGADEEAAAGSRRSTPKKVTATASAKTSSKASAKKVTATKSTAKKTPAKKAAVKKAPAKKTTAKKTTAKKSAASTQRRRSA